MVRSAEIGSAVCAAFVTCVTFATCVACGPTPPGAPASTGRCAMAAMERDGGAGGACVELGIGRDAVAAEDGEGVELVNGPQGGWHFEVGARIHGVSDPSRLTAEYGVTRARDGATLGAMRYAISVRRLVTDGEYVVRSGDAVVLDVPSGDDLVGEDVILSVEIQDRDGAAIARDERTLQVVDQTR